MDLPPILRDGLAELPRNPDGWWHQSDGEAYEQLARELLALGAGPEQALEILARAYAAAANEYGG